MANPPTAFVLPGDTTNYTQPGTPVYFDAPPYDAWAFTVVPRGVTVTPGEVSDQFRTPPKAVADAPGVYKVELVNSATGEIWKVTLSVSSQD